MRAQYTSRAAQLYRQQLEKDAAKLTALPKPEALDQGAPAAAPLPAAPAAPAAAPPAVHNGDVAPAAPALPNGDAGPEAAAAYDAGLENGAAPAAASTAPGAPCASLLSSSSSPSLNL
jgi:hypothetical protein